MKYKILYLEDLKAESMVSDFEKENIELVVNKASSIDVATKVMRTENFDAYLMDYRLSQGKSFFDAPPFAAYLRTEDKRGRMTQKPIFLITSEKGLNIVTRDDNHQDLFDLVMLKDDYNKHKKETIDLFISYIEAYRVAELHNYRTEEVLQIEKEEVKAFVDDRLLKELYVAKTERNTYEYLRKVADHLLNATGVLIDERYLAARLGVDKDKDIGEWNKLTVELAECLYCGVLSESYDRWWMPLVQKWWEGISGGKSLRRMDARERVELLNHQLNLKLHAAEPLKFCESKNYWTVCKALGLPLDPSEGYVCNQRPKRPWEENDYISALGALEFTSYQKYLSVTDRKEVIDYGKGR